MESLKMDSPVKKLDFSAGKENAPIDSNIDALAQEIDSHQQIQKKEEQKAAVAPTIRPEEADEPILQENPQRFVLFPIKYHEVSKTRLGRVK